MVVPSTIIGNLGRGEDFGGEIISFGHVEFKMFMGHPVRNAH